MLTQRTETAVAAIVALSLLASSHARAQERDPAAAQALFDQGQALVNARRYAEACTKLAESLRLDPGIGTQFHLAACHEQEGKIASAWAEFLEVASLATASGQDARAKAASRRAALLEPRLPRLKVVVPAASRAAGLEITRDGVVVGEAQWELAVPVDPGVRQLEVTAPNRRAFAGAVTAAEGATTTFEVPVLEEARVVAVGGSVASVAPDTALASGSHSTEAASTPSPVPPPPLPEDAPPPEPSSGPSGLVIGLGIGGIVAIGAGSVLGLMAINENDASKKHCDLDDPNRCDATGVDLRDDAFLFGNIATAGFVVGGAAIAAAAVLWIADGSEEGPEGGAVAIGVGPGGVAVRGAF